MLPGVRPPGVILRYRVVPQPEDWVVPEGTVPESVMHNEAARELELRLRAWAERSPRALAIARNLAIHFYEDQPRLGIDPNVCVLEPPPEEFQELTSLCLWKEGHWPPPLSIEIVSLSHPNKDYRTIQDRYAAMGARELVIFDPLLAARRVLGGPVPLQLWRYDGFGLLERVHASAAPAFSEVLRAWLIPDGQHLAIATDRAGEQRWLTNEEQARAEDERARTEKENERAQRTELERSYRR